MRIPATREIPASRRTVAPGVTLEEGTFRGASYHLVEVDRAEAARTLVPVLSGAPWGRTVSALDAQAGALATLNGTFFGYRPDGRPEVYGEVKTDGDAVRPTMIKRRTYLVVGRDGSLGMGEAEPRGTDSAGRTVYGIPPSRWDSARYVLGGGGRLVREGRKDSTGAGRNDQEFQPDVLARRNRAAVGFDDDHVWLVASDAPGWTPETTADFMLSQGAREAMFLDGGGSTTLVVQDAVVNRLSAGEQRRMPTAIALV